MRRFQTFATLLLAGTLGMGLVGCGDDDKPDPPVSDEDTDELAPPNIEMGSGGDSDADDSDADDSDADDSDAKPDESGTGGDNSDSSTTAE